MVLYEAEQFLSECFLEVSSEFGVKKEVENRIDARIRCAQPLG